MASFRNATSAQGNPVANQSITLPTIVSGDDVILLIGYAATGATLSFTGTAASSWFHVGTDSLIAAQCGLGCYVFQSLDGSESAGTATLNFTVQTKFACVVASYSGMQQSTPFGLSSPLYAQNTTSNTTSATSPSVSPVPSSWVLECFTSKSSTNASYTTPAGLTLRASVFGAGGGAIDLALFDSNGPVSSGGGHTSTMGTATANKIAGTLVLNDQLMKATMLRQAVNRAAVI